MSNFKNAFGNSGWIQSSIDKSRGKRRPGDRQRDFATGDAARRKKTLEEDPLYQKYSGNAAQPSGPSGHRRGVLRVASIFGGLGGSGG